MNLAMEPIPGQPVRMVMALAGSMQLAARIVKSAQLHHLQIRNFDKAEKLAAAAQAQAPVIVILDFEAREAESFKLLKAARENAVLKRASLVGFVSNDKRDVKREAENAGCLRVYLKTEFLSGLDDLWLRYAK